MRKNNPKYRVRATAWNKASSEETNLQNEQSTFYKTLIDDYMQQFQNQSNITRSLQIAAMPLLQGGINQYGFSPQEDTSIRTQASDSIAQGQANAQTALNENLAARGGGNAVYGSGAEGQLEAGLLANAANQQAQTSNQITQAGYAQGRQNFLSAAGILSNDASLINPLGFAGATTGAGSAAFNSANIVNQQNTAWQGALGGVIGGALGSFLGPIGTSLGSQVGGAITGNGAHTSP